jgi:lipopolysaccharide export system protein LptA
MEGSDEYAEGWANRLEYDGRAEKLKLIGQARLKRGEDDLRGNLITYDGKTESFQAQGSISGSPGRVRAVIRPKTGKVAPATQP